MEKSETGDMARRKILNIAVSAILMETGFDAVDRMSLETLGEILQCFITELGNSAKGYCELASRTEPLISDVMVALINMGISIRGIEQYAARSERRIVAAPQTAVPSKSAAMLSAGQKQKLPSHIPQHLPALPDPHAYIRTPTHKQPITEYEAVREKAAQQKRDIERALTRFLAKTGETHSLFNTDDNQMFPLIACKPTFPSYLAAINPTDQVFDFEELEYHFQVANRTEDIPATDKKDISDNEGDGEGENSGAMEVASSAALDQSAPQSPQQIDNPYLKQKIST